MNQEDNFILTNSVVEKGIFSDISVMGSTQRKSIENITRDENYKSNFWDPKMSISLNEAIDKYNKTAMPYHRIALYQRKKLTIEAIEKIVGAKVVEENGKYFLANV